MGSTTNRWWARSCLVQKVSTGGVLLLCSSHTLQCWSLGGL